MEPRSHRTTVAACCLLAVTLAAGFDAAADATVLYDPDQGVLPDASPWSWAYGAQQAPGSPPALREIAAGAAVFDTTGGSMRAGYNLGGVFGGMPEIDGTGGFSIDFTLRVAAESHSGDDRAGFSVIVLDRMARGIELGFWGDRVWASEADDTFSRAEGSAVDTGVLRTYTLSVQGNAYTLDAAGMASFGGELRDYASWAPFPFNVVPYNQANYVFLGDNTLSAAARVELVSVVLNPAAMLQPVPEPQAWALMLAGAGCVGWAARRSRARARGTAPD